MKQLARRYARALFSIAQDTKQQDQVLAEMRVIAEAVARDPELRAFVESRHVRPTEKEAALNAALETLPVCEPLRQFLPVLARKGRLPLFAGMVEAYQTISDAHHGVTRGVVRSAGNPGPEERQRISELVSKATQKQVILTYQDDPSLLGGLVAEVGSLTFDDSLATHLRRMNEQLTRSVP